MRVGEVVTAGSKPHDDDAVRYKRVAVGLGCAAELVHTILSRAH